MMELGKTQELIVVSRKSHGAYLGESADAGPDARVLLPEKEVPKGAEAGSRIEVFLYRDSSDRLIATTAHPKIGLHETALLRVSETTKIGAFLDWGLPKELLLPFQEQTAKLHQGDVVLAALYEDRSGRLAATMKVYPYLRTDSPYLPEAEVSGRVYQVTEGHGAYVAVDDIYSGMIPEREMPGSVRVGDLLTLRITAVKEDGKLDLAVRKKAYLQLEEDAAAVYDCIRGRFHGELPYDDHASPARIREDFDLSKAAFKRAVGRLLRDRLVALEEGHIRVTSVRQEA